MAQNSNRKAGAQRADQKAESEDKAAEAAESEQAETAEQEQPETSESEQAETAESEQGGGDPAPAKPETEPKAERPDYEVAQGRSITVRGKGQLDEGSPVKAEWFPNGKDDLKRLINRGAVVANR